MNFIGPLTPCFDTTRGRHFWGFTPPRSIKTKPPRPRLGECSVASIHLVTNQLTDPLITAPTSPSPGPVHPTQCGWTAEPMNRADRKVKMYACKNATNSSSRLRQITPPMLAGITR